MKYIALIIFLIFLIEALSCSNKSFVKTVEKEETGETLYIKTNISLEKGPEMHKILILPFECGTDPKKYANSQIHKTIIFNSLYYFFYIVPGIDLPDRSVLTNTFFHEESILKTADLYGCDFIVFGNYELKGKQTDPAALINMKIWSRISGRILTNSLRSPTDIGLFDTIDKMNGIIIKSVLNEKMRTANLNLSGFKLNNQKVELYINNKLISEVPNDDFSMNLKILSDADYHIMVKRVFDNKIMTNQIFHLNPGESAAFSFINNRINLCQHGTFDSIKEIIDLPLAVDDDVLKIIDADRSGKWNLRMSEGARAKASIENKECHIVIYNKGGAWYSLSLLTAPFRIETGKKYSISFDARSAEPRILALKMGKFIKWINYLGFGSSEMPIYINIDKDMKTYSHIFKMNYQTDDKAYFEINLTSSAAEIWINNIWVEEIIQ